MNRRQFLSSSTVSALALGSNFASADTYSPSPSAADMKLGDQTSPTNETHLKYLARYGVRNICGYPEIDGRSSLRHRGRAETHGGPGRQVRHQRRLHRASIPGVEPHRQRKASGHHAGARARSATATSKQLQTYDPQLRAGRHSLHQIQHEHPGRGAHADALPGRGDAMYSTWNLAKTPSRNAAHQGRRTWMPIGSGSASPTSSIASFRWPTSTRSAWPAIRTTRRAARRLPGRRSRAGHRRRAEEIHHHPESPYHGLNFCQGTVSEMLAGSGHRDLRRDPLLRHAQEDLQCALPQHPRPSQRLRRSLSRRGRRRFREGDPGLQGGRLSLHADARPCSHGAEADPHALQSFAFCYGYIRALIQFVNSAA